MPRSHKKLVLEVLGRVDELEEILRDERRGLREKIGVADSQGELEVALHAAVLARGEGREELADVLEGQVEELCRVHKEKVRASMSRDVGLVLQVAALVRSRREFALAEQLAEMAGNLSWPSSSTR